MGRPCVSSAAQGRCAPLACAAAERWEQLTEKQRGGEGVTSNPQNIGWIMDNTKPCPNCKAPIEKNGGCNHMHCTTCSHDFDWCAAGSAFLALTP